MNDVVIEARQVTKRYTMADEPISILNGVNLLVRRGEMVVIRGMSGSGKTTLLNVLGGLDTFEQGEVVVANTKLNSANLVQLTRFRAEKIGFVFQFHNLIPTLTVLENVLCGLEAMRPLRTQDAEQALHYLNRVGLKGHESKFPAQLSGGQQQRVAIARALVKEPEVILADEPTGSLDESTGLSIMNLLSDLQTEKQTTVVIVTHNPDLAPHANHHFEMRQGVLCIQDGSNMQGEKQCVNS